MVILNVEKVPVHIIYISYKVSSTLPLTNLAKVHLAELWFAIKTIKLIVFKLYTTFIFFIFLRNNFSFYILIWPFSGSFVKIIF